MVFSLSDRQRKDHLGTWLPVGSCPTLPALLQCYCLPLTSLKLSTTASVESQQCSGAPCLAKPSVSPSAHTTQPTCMSHMTFGNTFHFLLCLLFALTRWKGVWDLCEMIDCLAGETRQLSGELLQQFVITQISSSPQCHKTYRSLNLGGISSLLNFLTSTFRSCVGDKLLRCTPTQTQNVLTMSDVSVVYIDSNHLFLAQKQVHLSNFIINQVLSFCLLHYLWKDNVLDI